jgi:hypothetical protein
MVIVVSTKAGFVSVTVITAVRCGPLLGATENAILPSPAPDAPCVMVRNDALLTAPHVQLLVVLMEIDPDPPAAGNVVVVFPVITWHPPEPLGDEGLSLQAVATKSSPATDAREASRTCANRRLDKNPFIATSCYIEHATINPNWKVTAEDTSVSLSAGVCVSGC